MKKSIVTTSIILFCFISIQSSAQIINGGFEEWETIDGVDRPVGWETNQDTTFIRMRKCASPIEGISAAKLFPSASSAFFDCNSTIRQLVDLEEPLTSTSTLSLHVKSLPDNVDTFQEVYIEVVVGFSNEDGFVGRTNWASYEPIKDFELVEIDIPYEEATLMSITISGGAINGATDGCHNQSISWVDDIQLNRTTSITEPYTDPRDALVIYPNPSSGRINVKQKGELYEAYKIYDAQGKTVAKGLIRNSVIEFDQKGLYVLELSGRHYNHSKVATKRIMVQ